jgi:hypothetical protein
MQIFNLLDKKGMSFEKSAGVYEGVHEALDYMEKRGFIKFDGKTGNK